MRRHLIMMLLFLVLASTIQARANPEESAVFAGGCFWCMEADFEKLPGVVDVVSGYSGGKLENPTYEQVSSGTTAHLEVVKVSYDPRQIDYAQLLDYYWRHIDPTRDDGQFCDRGSQYRPAIFYRGEQQKRLAEASLAKLQHSKPFAEEIKVELLPAGPFYPAEAYHQDYYKKNPLRYHFYRYRCGRDARVEALWGDD